MRLATLREGGRDGTLIVVSEDGTRFARAAGIATTLQDALERWRDVEASLQHLSVSLRDGQVSSEVLDINKLHAPLPRAYEWIDGSAYLNHILLVRRARGAVPPADWETNPLVYQGGSSGFLGPKDPMMIGNPAWGLDFEAEIAVVLDDTPQATTATEASSYIRLIMLCNDITLRNLVPDELQKGFGFFLSKPASAFAPFAITPDELGPSFSGGRLQSTLHCRVNDVDVGRLQTGEEMHFSFLDLMAHICRTRSYCAGTVLGGGTVSNHEASRGVACLAEKRVREVLEHGQARTPFLVPGDVVEISAHDAQGNNLFGTIRQRVVAS